MAKFEAPRFLSEREINTIRGKSIVGHASIEELQRVFGHIDVLEMKLDELSDQDFFGTEGWRHFLGLPDAE